MMRPSLQGGKTPAHLLSPTRWPASCEGIRTGARTVEAEGMWRDVGWPRAVTRREAPCMSGPLHGEDGAEELIWPPTREFGEPLAPFPDGGEDAPSWMDEPTLPNLPVVPRMPRRAASAPQWPGPREAAGQFLRHAEDRQLSLGFGALAVLIILAAGVLAVMTRGLPFFGGNGSSPNGVQANPLVTATAMPTATATSVPTLTPTRVPTATSAPTQAPTVTSVPTITPSPAATPSPPPATPSPTATTPPTPPPSATPTSRRQPAPTPTTAAPTTPTPGG
jgi:hypothetical protein